MYDKGTYPLAKGSVNGKRHMGSISLRCYIIERFSLVAAYHLPKKHLKKFGDGNPRSGYGCGLFFSWDLRLLHSTWQEEHERYLTELKKNTPVLVSRLEYYATGFVPEFNGQAAVMFWVSVANLGMQSIADGWRLETILLDGRRITSNATMMPETVTFHLANGRTRTIYREDALYNKLVNPLPQGGKVVGVLLFVMPDIKFDEVQMRGVSFTLRFNDVTGKSYESSKILSGQNAGDIEYFPGMRVPKLMNLGRILNFGSQVFVFEI
jgi:hypothetical protein